MAFSLLEFLIHLTFTLLLRFAETSKVHSAPNGFDRTNYVLHNLHYLNITSLGAESVQQDIDCGFACATISSCFSFNLAALPDITSKYLCELLPSDKYNNSDNFTTNQLFHHFSIQTTCSKGPCENNGTCLPLYNKNTHACLCEEGYTGNNCQTEINECASNPCQNEGTCIDHINGYNCSCAPGFNGTWCETDLNECESNLCLNGGTCVDGVNEFNCSCLPAYEGSLCETAINMSTDSVILSTNAVYLDHLNQYLVPVLGANPSMLLCWRASTHGWAASIFHDQCDGKPHTVTIVKAGPYVFGAYTDMAWTSESRYIASVNSFIFSLHDNENLAPFKATVKTSAYAIRGYHSYGPTFGGGFDLRISDNANSNALSYTNFGHSYTVPSDALNQKTILAGTFYFTPEELEVFYLN